MKILRAVFYIENIFNIITVVYATLFPVQFVALFTSQQGGTVSELLRWYGILLVVFIYLELYALLSKRDELLCLILQGFLIGDILQLIASVQFASTGAGWGTSLIISEVFTIILVISRLSWLWLYYTKRSRERMALASESQ